MTQSPKGPLSPLCFACPTCGVTRGIGCRTGRGEATGAHATREALGVACPVPGCLQPAGRVCTGAIPGHGKHHPERLYQARGQVAPGFGRALKQQMEGFYQFCKDHPAAVVELHIYVTVREEAQLPPDLLGDSGGRFRFAGSSDEGRELHMSVRVTKSEAPRPAPAPAGLPEGGPQVVPLGLPPGQQRGPLLLSPPQGGGRALCDDHRRAAALPLAAAQCTEQA